MKSTKKALVLSLLAMLLCVSMLIGTTFAWFTDTATSSNNRIVAGNLDVDLVMYNGKNYVSIAGGSGDIFNTAAIAQNKPASLWEPGKTQIVYLGVQNKGNLAIKYNIILDVTDTDTTDGVNLADVLDFAIIDGAKAGDTNYTYANWAAVTNAASTTGVIGTLMGTNPARITAAQNGTLDEIRNGTQNETDYFVLAVHMQETAGNEYQGKEIVIDLSVVATQKDAEEDSFNNQYDAGLDTPTAPTAIHDIATATFEEPAEITTDTTGATPVSTATVAATTIQTTDATSTIAAPTTVTLSDYTAPTATDTTDKVTGLTRTIDTTASSETGVTYNIGYKATVTTTTNNVVVGTEEYAVHTFGSIVENVVNVGAGLTNVKVTHGGSPMNPADNTTAKADGTYYYDSATGDLYIWSSTYSAYTISWDIPEYVASVGSNNYTTLKGAFNAAQNGDTITLLRDVTVTEYVMSTTSYIKDYVIADGGQLMYGTVIEGNGHTVTLEGTGSKHFLGNFGGTMRNLTVSGLTGSLLLDTYLGASFENVTVEGEQETSGNDGGFAVYVWSGTGNTLTFTDCVADMDFHGTGTASDYNGAFVGYFVATDYEATFTRCENKGDLVCGSAGMFIGNVRSYTAKIYINDCKNTGLIHRTYAPEETYRHNNILYGTTSDWAATTIIDGVTYTMGQVNNHEADNAIAGSGRYIVGDESVSLGIVKNSDGTFTVSTDNAVASYTVYYGLYTSKNQGGSSRTFVTQSFTTTDETFTTSLTSLKFVDSAWVAEHEGAECSSPEWNDNVKIYTFENESYYLIMNATTDNLGGEVSDATLINVSGYDQNGVLIVSAGLS